MTPGHQGPLDLAALEPSEERARHPEQRPRDERQDQADQAEDHDQHDVERRDTAGSARGGGSSRGPSCPRRRRSRKPMEPPMRLAGRFRARVVGSVISSQPSTPVNERVRDQAVVGGGERREDEPRAMLGRDRDLLVVERGDLRCDAADARPPGRGPRPEKSETRAITTLIGSVRQSIFETSPERLSSIDSSRLVGAWRYFTSRPTASENGRQMTGNIQRFAVTKAFSQRSRLTVSKTTSQTSTATAPMTATMTTWTYGWTGRSGVTDPRRYRVRRPNRSPTSVSRRCRSWSHP